MSNFSFRVIDNKTGEEADTYKIALKEDWAKGLMYCDMEGFAISEDGHLLLLDECGNAVYCPNDRFIIIPEDSVLLSKEEWQQIKNLLYYSKEELENNLQKALKETVREILKWLVDTGMINIAPDTTKMYFKEQFDVEVEE